MKNLIKLYFILFGIVGLISCQEDDLESPTILSFKIYELNTATNVYEESGNIKVGETIKFVAETTAGYCSFWPGERDVLKNKAGADSTVVVEGKSFPVLKNSNAYQDYGNWNTQGLAGVKTETGFESNPYKYTKTGPKTITVVVTNHKSQTLDYIQQTQNFDITIN
jgi:hypothetical protein